MHWVRIIVGGTLALALAALSIMCCYLFGTHLAPGVEGQVYGFLGGVADAFKAVLPIFITAAFVAKQRTRAFAGIAVFLVFSVYSFISELGLYALSRSAAASTTMAKKEGYDELKRDREKLQEQLAALGRTRLPAAVEADMAAERQKLIWQSTKECTDASWPQARKFCSDYEHLKADWENAKEAARLRSEDSRLGQIISGVDLAKVLGSADPQVDTLSRFTGFSPAAIRDGLAVLVAVLIELGSGLGLWVATGGATSESQPGSLQVVPPPAAPSAVAALPAPAKEPKPRKAASKPAKKAKTKSGKTPRQPEPAPQPEVTPHPEVAQTQLSATILALPAADKGRDALVAQFIEERITRVENETVSAQEVLDAFKAYWPADAGEAPSQTVLGRALSNAGIAKGKWLGKVVYQGISLAA